MRGEIDTLVVSCYELGHQPLAAASAVAFLERSGRRVAALDLAVEPLDAAAGKADPAGLRLVALAVPMHTALHIGVRAARRLRELAPAAHLCFFGLYASLNAEHLLVECADSVIGGEAEPVLVALADALAAGRPLEEVAGLHLRERPARPVLARASFPAPSRDTLPPLDRYARLEIGSERRLAAAVETSRGCLHHCRHCPIPAVYGGRFFVVPRDVVQRDVRRVVDSGARHLTFADPDFFNGPGHSMAVVRALHAEFPDVTFDVTTKVENLLAHRDKLGELADCGCLFVVSAVESLSDSVLGHLLKGHTRRDVARALELVRSAGMVLRPSLVAFTPWTTLDDYVEVLEWVEREELIGSVDAVQLSIRLLVPPGSLLVDLAAMRPHLRGLEPERFSWSWEHPDPRMDRLHGRVSEIVQEAARDGSPARATFDRIVEAASRAGGVPRSVVKPTRVDPARAAAAAPRLTEPWFC